MSCVVGYVEDGKIYMGADSACINAENLDIRTRTDPKVFVRENFIFGYVGSYRVGQVLRCSFFIPPIPEGMSDFDYLCSLFIPRLISSLKENDCFQYKNEGEFCFEGEIMIGYNKEIYIIGSDLQVISESEKYSSIGCGENYAIGALYILEKMFPLTPPEEKVKYALEVAEYYNAGVRRPFILCSM